MYSRAVAPEHGGSAVASGGSLLTHGFCIYTEGSSNPPTYPINAQRNLKTLTVSVFTHRANTAFGWLHTLCTST